MTAISAPPMGDARPPPYPDTAVVDMTMGLMCLVINLIVPGVGTIVAGVLGEKPHIGRGIAQLLLAFIVVGWIWALVTSIQLLQNAKWKESQGRAS